MALYLSWKLDIYDFSGRHSSFEIFGKRRFINRLIYLNRWWFLIFIFFSLSFLLSLSCFSAHATTDHHHRTTKQQSNRNRFTFSLLSLSLFLSFITRYVSPVHLTFASTIVLATTMIIERDNTGLVVWLSLYSTKNNDQRA